MGSRGGAEEGWEEGWVGNGSLLRAPGLEPSPCRTAQRSRGPCSPSLEGQAAMTNNPS